MTPGARVAAAIAVLDAVRAGQAAEQALTNWGRGSRYAGSGDRAAVRDLVFGALRCLRSYAALGGSDSGRGLMIGAVRAQGGDPAAVFTGAGHAPQPLTGAEQVVPKISGPEVSGPAVSGLAVSGLAALDCPDWLAPALQQSLGDGFEPVMRRMQSRAPVFLRANLLRATVPQAIERLAAEGITAQTHPLAATALEVTENARKIQTSQTYLEGRVELQDAASQAILAGLPLHGARVLDYCAGGGGKALAMAALGAQVWVHDADPRRMRDLPVRAARAGAAISTFAPPCAPFDLVLLDVPCSGSGSWRRNPEGKWALTAERLEDLIGIQAGILDVAMGWVAPRGHLAYATCSMLAAENTLQIAAFLARHPGWVQVSARQLTPLDGGDGFYVTLLTRE